MSTIIAEDLRRQVIGGSDRSVGVFECKNVTVVNGAQTVGTIGRTLAVDESPAFRQARVIVVDDLEALLGKRITRASNTQNKIDARNFVALDPEQERIRTELLIEKINYEYREVEPLESTVDGFEFIEAVTTRAQAMKSPMLHCPKDTSAACTRISWPRPTKLFSMLRILRGVYGAWYS